MGSEENRQREGTGKGKEKPEVADSVAPLPSPSSSRAKVISYLVFICPEVIVPCFKMKINK